MEKVIYRIIRRLFPELTTKLHLPMWGRVVALPELPSDENNASDPFYPRYAANVQLLNEHGEDADIEMLQTVPLPLPGAGNNAGRLEPPAIGAIVEVGFAYGRADKPFIRTVLPFGFDLPAIKDGESRIQTCENGFQHIDKIGNFTTISQINNLLVEQSQQIKVLKDQVTQITGNQIITAKNITQDADTIKLNGGAAVVTCGHICHFTGNPHGDGSSTVTAGE
jgi:hypothetical protein